MGEEYGKEATLGEKRKSRLEKRGSPAWKEEAAKKIVNFRLKENEWWSLERSGTPLGEKRHSAWREEAAKKL